VVDVQDEQDVEGSTNDRQQLQHTCLLETLSVMKISYNSSLYSVMEVHFTWDSELHLLAPSLSTLAMLIDGTKLMAVAVIGAIDLWVEQS
jgi:hypothetical protein